MGRLLRVSKAQAAVPSNGKCFSSCVFLLAGATGGYVAGPVGIHRPYAPHDVNTTAAGQRQWYQGLEKEAKAFPKDVNVPQEIYDHMIRIPPERMTLLSRTELQRYGLSEDDPFESAATDAGLAKSLGISTQEGKSGRRMQFAGKRSERRLLQPNSHARALRVSQPLRAGDARKWARLTPTLDVVGLHAANGFHSVGGMP